MRILMAILAAVFLLSCDEIGALTTGDEVPDEENTLTDSGYVFDDNETASPNGEGTNEPTADGPQPLELKAEVAAPTTLLDTPVQSKPSASPAQRLACQRQKGVPTRTAAGLFVCVQETGQGRKSCSKASDCKGECLARSNTCAPFTPLIGCNDVITARGGRATVCVN